jgi:hypothetical protein
LSLNFECSQYGNCWQGDKMACSASLKAAFREFLQEIFAGFCENLLRYGWGIERPEMWTNDIFGSIGNDAMWRGRRQDLEGLLVSMGELIRAV